MLKVMNDPKVQPNFKLSELVCNCGCGEVLYVPEAVERLQKLRDSLNEAYGGGCWIEICVGHRCKNYNEQVPKASPKSRHTYVGDAIDIKCWHNKKQLDPKHVAEFAIAAGFTGIGVYKYMGQFFTHIDCREKKRYWQQTRDGKLIPVSGF